MVEFFNKKEDVIDFQLTEYGKHVLSRGMFRPTYYAFYDDNILYDSEYGGFMENQNDADKRIREDTPYFKVIPTITSVEERVTRFIANVSSSLGNLSDQAMASSDVAFAFRQQSFQEKVNLLAGPLGKSSLSQKYAPAWKVATLTNSISSSAAYIETRGSSFATGTETAVSGVVQQIPQLDIEVDYRVFAKSGEMTSNAITGYLEASPSVYLAMKEDYVVLSIEEKNTDNEKENFEIEVFYSGSNDPTSPPEPLIQLAFLGLSGEMPQSIGNNVNKVPNVEYYMDVLVDKEIPQNIVDNLDIQDIISGPTSTRSSLQQDLYTTQDEDPCA